MLSAITYFIFPRRGFVHLPLPSPLLPSFTVYSTRQGRFYSMPTPLAPPNSMLTPFDSTPFHAQTTCPFNVHAPGASPFHSARHLLLPHSMSTPLVPPPFHAHATGAPLIPCPHHLPLAQSMSTPLSPPPFHAHATCASLIPCIVHTLLDPLAFLAHTTCYHLFYFCREVSCTLLPPT